MKEQLYTELLEIITASKDGVAKGFEFAYEQSPLLIDEIIRFNLIRCSLNIAIWFIVFCFLIKAAYYCFKKYNNNFTDESVWIMGSFTISVTAAMLLLPALISITNLIKILVAPRLYLIEYLTEFVK